MLDFLGGLECGADVLAVAAGLKETAPRAQELGADEGRSFELTRPASEGMQAMSDHHAVCWSDL